MKTLFRLSTIITLLLILLLDVGWLFNLNITRIQIILPFSIIIWIILLLLRLFFKATED